MQKIIQLFPNLSRKELARTVGEPLRWTTPIGQYKVPSCMTLLMDELEAHGIVPLPAKQVKQAPGHPIPAFQEPPATAPITDTLAAVAPITLHQVPSQKERACGKAYLQTCHLFGRAFNLSGQL